jgi:membrane fusion protein (multidrug efflux system)
LSTEQQANKEEASKEEQSIFKGNWDMKRVIATVISIVVAIAIVGICSNIVKMWTADTAKESTEENADTNEETGVSGSATVDVIPIKKVKTLAIANKNIKSGFSAQGRLRAYDKTDIVAEVQGMMLPTLEKRFKIGTRYTKDEVMIDIENVESRLALKSQKAQLHTAITAMMPDMKIDMPASFSNWKAYLDKFDVNQSIRTFPKHLSDREEYYVSTKNLHSQFYNIKSAEVRLEKFQVKAPFDGILTTSSVNKGGFVRAGSPLGTLMNTAKYEMEAAVQVADLAYIKRGSSVKVTSDDSGKSWTGIVKRIGDLVDATTQTATVYIGLSGNGLREGQYLRAMINTSAITQATEIPRSWLVDNDKLYVIEGGTLKLQTVEVVKVEDDKAIVRGMKNDTRLLAEKVKGAYEGMKVEME